MKTFKLILVWLWVAVPLGWGVMKSVKKATPLFMREGRSATTPDK